MRAGLRWILRMPLRTARTRCSRSAKTVLAVTARRNSAFLLAFVDIGMTVLMVGSAELTLRQAPRVEPANADVTPLAAARATPSLVNRPGSRASAGSSPWPWSAVASFWRRDAEHRSPEPSGQEGSPGEDETDTQQAAPEGDAAGGQPTDLVLIGPVRCAGSEEETQQADGADQGVPPSRKHQSPRHGLCCEVTATTCRSGRGNRPRRRGREHGTEDTGAKPPGTIDEWAYCPCERRPDFPAHPAHLTHSLHSTRPVSPPDAARTECVSHPSCFRCRARPALSASVFSVVARPPAVPLPFAR
ncbi:hypothetical protein GKJPGBOP_00136 [Streptomyces paromomycinus]|uniref:Uncharacterized protein n=1 Tax=Streptomyces paromomycinus TaxID=92743 RepID=A0A401VTS1_STREY|nr:hypothetical protein GKJPGBOP_00136 [Streptomyces paromomycinus]